MHRFRGAGDVPYVRKEILRLCRQSKFDEEKINEIILAVTEIMANVVKHGGGVAFIEVSNWVQQNNVIGIEISVRDKGKGITDISKAMKDRTALNNANGYGLASIKRLADDLLILSPPSNGIIDSDNEKSGTLLIFRKRR